MSLIARGLFRLNNIFMNFQAYNQHSETDSQLETKNSNFTILILIKMDKIIQNALASFTNKSHITRTRL